MDGTLVAVERLSVGVGPGLLGPEPVAMLSEEALVLYGVFVGLGLLALGIWEQLSPARSRFPTRSPRPDDARRRDGD